ncbi:hypothetical protein M419DRAFT_120682, partial [Trichoderma reesei RUT C-30]
ILPWGPLKEGHHRLQSKTRQSYRKAISEGADLENKPGGCQLESCSSAAKRQPPQPYLGSSANALPNAVGQKSAV